MKYIGLDLGNTWYSIGRPEEIKMYESKKRIDDSSNLINIPLKFSISDSKNIKTSFNHKKSN